VFPVKWPSFDMVMRDARSSRNLKKAVDSFTAGIYGLGVFGCSVSTPSFTPIV